jgi:hypothetical protein
MIRYIVALVTAVSGLDAYDFENQANGSKYPADYFNLKPFKLQVPYSSSGSFTSGSPVEI